MEDWYEPTISDELWKEERNLQAAFEAFSVSTEGFQSVIKNLIAALRRFWGELKRLFSKFGKAHSTRIGVTGVKVNRMLERYSTKGLLTSANSFFTVSSGVGQLSVNYVPIKNAMGLLNALGNFGKDINQYFTWVNSDMISLGDKVANKISNVRNPTEVNQDRFTGDIQHKGPRELLKKLGMRQVEEGTYASAPLLGNRCFYVKGSPTPTMINEYARDNIMLADSGQAKAVAPNVAFSHFSLKQGIDLLKASTVLIDTLERNYKSDVNNKRQRTLDALMGSIDRVERAWVDSEPEPLIRKNVEHLVGLARSCMTWVTNPYDGATNLTLSVVNATVNLCGRNLAQPSDS